MPRVLARDSLAVLDGVPLHIERDRTAADPAGVAVPDAASQIETERRIRVRMKRTQDCDPTAYGRRELELLAIERGEPGGLIEGAGGSRTFGCRRRQIGQRDERCPSGVGDQVFARATAPDEV